LRRETNDTAKPDRIEFAENWKLASATEAQSERAAISIARFKDARWHPIRRMPARRACKRNPARRGLSCREFLVQITNQHGTILK